MMKFLHILVVAFCAATVSGCTTTPPQIIPFPPRPIVTVVGDVRNEGDVGWHPALTVSDAVRRVGGPTSGRVARITHTIPVVVSLDEAGPRGRDILLEPGDIIDVSITDK